MQSSLIFSRRFHEERAHLRILVAKCCEDLVDHRHLYNCIEQDPGPRGQISNSKRFDIHCSGSLRNSANSNKMDEFCQLKITIRAIVLSDYFNEVKEFRINHFFHEIRWTVRQRLWNGNGFQSSHRHNLRPFAAKLATANQSSWKKSSTLLDLLAI